MNSIKTKIKNLFVRPQDRCMSSKNVCVHENKFAVGKFLECILELISTHNIKITEQEDLVVLKDFNYLDKNKLQYLIYTKEV